MVKHEQHRTTDQLKRVGSMAPLPLRPLVSQTISQALPRRSIDSHAIDISSIHGRFAWEKITLGDTYIPVIFRGTTKYFCIKMLHKLLHEYPEDVIRRSSNFQYWKPIDLYEATINEIELLNYINTHHCHWTYSREPFTNKDELVRVLDFLPFYQHLRLYGKLSSPSQIPPTDSLRPILPQPQQRQQSVQTLPDFVVDLQKSMRRNSILSTATASIPIRPPTAQELPQRNIPLNPRPIAPTPTPTPRPTRPPSYGAQQFVPRAPSIPSQQRKAAPLVSTQLTAISSDSMFNSANTVISTKVWPSSTPSPVSQPLTSTVSPLAINPTSSTPLVPSLLTPHIRKQPINSPEKQLASAAKRPSFSSSSASSLSKSPRLHCGWLQINKLYTPYVSNNVANHHLYKIPISLLTFYDLLKFPSLENNTNDPKYVSFLSDQILVTPQEIELINELCLKQSIKPFSVDTKLINLSTFYRYSSANILFVKELPMNEPKASICKDWSSIVQISGGICRLRNTTTLHEQTVPFIGNNLLKTFIISSQCLASASLSAPSPSEMEFLQLVLFFSNISINLRNAKLIDIESVQKEYNVDLILLFNDKFPLNVLNYQHQGNRSSTSQDQTNQSNSSESANTFAESTPPPSPLSPPINNPRIHHTAQLPLTSPSASSSSTPNRFQKTISFRGHPMTAYICSGIGVNNSQRECVSVKALCDMLYPNSSILDKLETRMLRLLRLKSINRFRPQNHQTLDFTRLVDINDIEKHWNYIEKGMCPISNNDEELKIVEEVTLSLSDIDFKASTLDTVENISEKIDEPEISIEIVKGEKRPLEGEMEDKYIDEEMEDKDIDEENTPVLERLEKRLRSADVDNNEQSKPIPEQLVKIMDVKPTHLFDDKSQDGDHNDQDDVKKKPIIAQRKPIPFVKIVKLKTHNETQKKSIQRPIDRKPGKSTLLIQKTTVPGKKKIRLVRRKPTPSVRSNEPIIAKWVRKYCIEDCCIRLNKYNPIYETGRD